MGATSTGATPTGPTLDPLNILVNKFNIATHVALILFLFSSWINYLLYDTKSVIVFWHILSKINRFVTIFRISWNGPTLFNIPIGDFPPSAVIRFPEMLPVRNIFYLLPMCCIFWEKCKNSPKPGLGCSTPFKGLKTFFMNVHFKYFVKESLRVKYSLPK